MSARADTSRRATVELRFDHAPATLPTVGDRALHQYWSLLAPHFRGVLLAPQWRAAGDGIAWSWREPAATASLSAAELATVRKRLASAQRSFANAAAETVSTGAQRAAFSLPQIQACTAAVINALHVLPDPALSAYMIRSESGPLLHSWGLSPPLVPFYPDIADKLISGTVFIAHQPAPGQEVLLETAEGEPVAHLHSDATGHFNFSKITPGYYRVRVASTLVAFPTEGTCVEIQSQSATTLELHDSDGARTAPGTHGRHNIKLSSAFLAVAVLILLGLLWFFFHGRSRPASPPSPTAASPQFSNVTSLAQTSAIHTDAATRPTEGRAPRPATIATPATVHNPAHSPSSTLKRDPSPPPASYAARSPFASASPASTQSGASNPSAGINNPPAPPTNPIASTPHKMSPSLAGTTAADAQQSPSDSPSLATVSDSASSKNPFGPSRQNSPPPPASTSPSSPKPSPPPTTAQKAELPLPAPLALSPSPRPSAPNSDLAPALSVSAAIASPPSLAAEESTLPQDSPPEISPQNPPPPLPPRIARVLAPAIEEPAIPSPAELAAITAHSPASTTHELLPHRTRLRLTPWTTRLLRDTILPTQPLRARDHESIDALRTRVFREHQRQIPPSFLPPDIHRGFAFDLPAFPSPSARPQWLDDTGAASPDAVVNGTHAELSWRAPVGTSPPTTTFHLIAGRRELARVTIDANGDATAHTSADVIVWPWLAFHIADNTAPSTSDARFDWQVLRGPLAPVTWRHTTNNQNPRSLRLDLIPPPAESGLRQRTLAVFDHTTGWALVSELEQVSEAAPPERAVR